jgi:DNA-binding CsgD family transcriptional regulator
MNPATRPLTDTEIEVLVDIAHGLDTAQMAAKQFRSQNTVRSHCKKILAKLSARNRAHAVAVAYDIGLFRAPTAEVRRCDHCSALLRESTSPANPADQDAT